MEAWNVQCMIGYVLGVNHSLPLTNYIVLTDGGDEATIAQAVHVIMPQARVERGTGGPWSWIIRQDSLPDQPPKECEQLVAALKARRLYGHYADTLQLEQLAGMQLARLSQQDDGKLFLESERVIDPNNAFRLRQVLATTPTSPHTLLTITPHCPSQDIGRWVRLLANILHVRLDPGDKPTREIVGAPLY